MSTTSVPETLEEFKALRYFPRDVRLAGLRDFKPRPSDVIIATTPKSGTTWMQQIVHGLRTRGSMDFDEISVVIPFLEIATGMGIDLDAEQVANPRVFKTHACYDFCPKGAGKYIVVIRNPLDALPSMYSFLNGWIFRGGPEMFIPAFLSRQADPIDIGRQPSIFYVMESWWRHHEDDNVRLYFYEDMLEDVAGVVKEVAEFIGCGVGDEELQKLVVKQASKEFMLAHNSQFDDHALKIARNKAVGFPETAGMEEKNSKVRGDKVGYRRKDLSAELVKEITSRWKPMEELTGCSSYDELRMKYGRKK